MEKSVMDASFDWGKKSLGEPGICPGICGVCGEDMSYLGWETWVMRLGRFCHCLSCKNTFHIGEIILTAHDG